MAEYYLACFILFVLILAFIPAMVAAFKKRHFTGWYVYSVFLFPIALAHSLTLKKPRHFIKIYKFTNDTQKRKIKRIYAAAPPKKEAVKLSFGRLCAVFFSKLLFGMLVALVLFALFRTFVDDTLRLRLTCGVFALIFSMLLMAVELLRISKFPLLADEITKRALEITWLSLLCSLPFFLLKAFVLDLLIPQHHDFTLFVCTMISFALFIFLLVSKQSKYYSFFHTFFDYCAISMFSYSIFAAVTLIFMSLVRPSALHYALAMPIQGFNLRYLSGVKIINDLSFIYSAALAHLFILLILLLSGLLCLDFKRKELEARIEYRSRAFNMEGRKILRRRIL